MKQNLQLFIIILIVTTLINLILIHFLVIKPKKIAVIDMQSITNEYVKNMANQEYNEEDSKKFITKINDNINQIAKDNNLIIIPKQAVFSGEDMDITEQFKEVLKNAE